MATTSSSLELTPLSLINNPESPWEEFEENFEHGVDNSTPCLENLEKHRWLSNRLAEKLSEQFDDPEQIFDNPQLGDNFLFEEYRKLAKVYFPEEPFYNFEQE